MITFENNGALAQTADERKLREWFARAVPVPVRFLSTMPEGLESALGAYSDGAKNDEIVILKPDDDRFGRDSASFLAVLAHEAVHATKHRDRLNRNNWEKTGSLEDALAYLDGTVTALEETTAYIAAVALAEELGFEPGELARASARVNFEGAPDHYRPRIECDVAAAVAWLKDRAATTDERPFDDDLARWAREG